MDLGSLGHLTAINLIYFRSAASAHKFDQIAGIFFEIQNSLDEDLVYFFGIGKFYGMNIGFGVYIGHNMLIRGPNFYLSSIYNNFYCLNLPFLLAMRFCILKIW